MHMKKAFHAVLSLVAVGGALVGAMPASAGFNTIVNTAHPVGTGLHHRARGNRLHQPASESKRDRKGHVPLRGLHATEVAALQ
jgi:hypothetical protein